MKQHLFEIIVAYVLLHAADASSYNAYVKGQPRAFSEILDFR